MHDMALVMVWSGRAEEALPWIDKALAFESGAGLGALLARKCYVHLLLGRYEEAVAECERSAGLAGDGVTYVFLTAAYAQHGDNAKAVATREQLFKRWPDFTLARWVSFVPSDNPVYWQAAEAHLFGGLRKAGVPEK